MTGPVCLLLRVVNIVSFDPDSKEHGWFVNFESKNTDRDSRVTWQPL